MLLPAVSHADDYEAALKAFNHFILFYLSSGATEQYTPNANVDLSEHLTADSFKRVARLRALRNEFEEIVTGALLDDKTRSPTAPVPPDPREP